MSTEPRVFVAGSSGYVGQAVMQELRTRGVKCIAHLRPGSTRGGRCAEHFRSLGAEIDRSPWEPDALEAALRQHQATHVLCLIGTTRKQARSEGLAGDIYDAVDYGLSVLLATAAAQQEPQPHFCYLSSIGADRDSRSPYLRARGRAESDIRALGLPTFIARPSFITGSDREESRPGERIGASVADAGLAALGLLGARKLRDRYRSCTAGELATALIDGSLAGKTGIFQGADLRP